VVGDDANAYRGSGIGFGMHFGVVGQQIKRCADAATRALRDLTLAAWGTSG
jgi:hypothetical protein